MENLKFETCKNNFYFLRKISEIHSQILFRQIGQEQDQANIRFYITCTLVWIPYVFYTSISQSLLHMEVKVGDGWNWPEKVRKS